MASVVDMQSRIVSPLPDIAALQELRERPQWVAWKYIEKNGRITKPPVNPHTGDGASHSDARTWGTYEQALHCARSRGLAGVGYVITDDDGFTGADLDKCRDPDFGQIEPWAQEVIDLAETYVEVSPSGTGLRLIWRGKVDQTFKCDPKHVEVYKSLRYLTITGEHIPGTPTEIRPAPRTESVLRERVESFRREQEAARAATRPEPMGVPLQHSPRPGVLHSGPGVANPFFRNLNDAAMRDIAAWVPALFGGAAVFQPTTRGFRVSSHSLGRDLEEDLSITPMGIVDFGVHDMGDPKQGKRTPLDIVLEFGGKPTAREAGLWLCDQIGKDPHDLGWGSTATEFPALFGGKPGLVDYTTAPLPEGIFEFLDVRQIKAMPDPKWLVEGLVTENGTGFIYGPPGSGKSFVAIGMGLSLAVGMPDWWGRQIQREGAVIYISSEGQSDLKFRIAAWEQTNGVVTDDAPFFLIRQSINFMQPDDIMKLLATVDAITEHHKVQPVAVFVDTVSRVLPGADENLQKDMTLFIAGCDAVRQRFGCTVIGVHHTSRAGNMRGSSVFDGAGDFLASIEREEGATIGTLTAKKIKAAADGWKEAFRLDEIAVSPTHTSLVAVPTVEAPEVKQPASWPDKDTCRRVLNEIEGAWVKGEPWSSFPQAKRVGRYAPRMMVQDYGIKPQIADNMLETWLMNGVLSVEIRDTVTKLKGLKVIGGIDS